MTSIDIISCTIDVYLVTWIPFSYDFMKKNTSCHLKTVLIFLLSNDLSISQVDLPHTLYFFTSFESLK